MAVHNDDIIISLRALKAKYFDAERLMCAEEPVNVNRLSSNLHDINVEFDNLMCLAINIDENETMPGTMSHKVDVIKQKGKLQDRIESWLRDMEVSGADGVNDVSGIVPRLKGDDMIAPVVKVTDHLSERSANEDCLSSRSSRASSLRASKVKVQLARLALKHEEERQQEATREKMRQLEMAEAELEAWEASSVSSKSVKINKAPKTTMPRREIFPYLGSKEAGIRVVPDRTKHISSDHSNCPKHSAESCTHEHDPRRHQPRAVNPLCLGPHPLEVSERFLPKPSIDPFDGDPLDYWAFVSRYEVHIAGRVNSPDLRLAYLLQHCTKLVQDKIKHHACESNKQLAYESVWKELYQRYGQPHIISRCCEERLVSIGKITQTDVEGLEKLAVLAKRCLTSLKETLGPTAIDSVGFIASIANKLPNDLRRQWVSKSVKILHREGKMANFADFTNFVSIEASKMNSAYYKAMYATAKHESGAWVGKSRLFNNATPSFQKLPRKAEFARSGEKEVLECVCCGKQHGLHVCEEFCRKTLADKKRLVRTKRLCFRCLKGGHMIKECRSSNTCAELSCNSTDHHTLLHPDQPLVKDPAPVCSATSREFGMHVDKTFSAYLDILPVRVCHGGKEVLTYALLDPGSSMTFCEPVLVEKLGLRGKGSMCETSVETLTTKHPERLKSKCYSMSIKPLNAEREFELGNVVVVKQIPVTASCRNVRNDLKGFDHLKDVTLPEIPNATVTLLIGNDNYRAQFPLEVRGDCGSNTSPCAIKTPLGWILKGPRPCTSATLAESGCSFLLRHGQLPDHLKDVRDTIVTEDGEIFPRDKNVGIGDIDNLMSWLRANTEVLEFGLRYSLEDVVSYELMNKAIKLVDGHFQLPLLWRNSGVTLPDSLPMAKSRLEAVKRRLDRDPVLKGLYISEMQALLDEGYVEEVPQDDEEKSLSTAKRVWYVPHHPVLNPNKPGKVRIVYDCAAQSHGTSLNENLMKGPDYVNSLMGVLLRFRAGKIAVVSDIKKMFYQVRCDPDHRDALRFLWYPNGRFDLEPLKYRMKVHLFGAKSSPSCAAFALLRTAKVYGKDYQPDVSTVVRENFYVDDCLVSVDDAETGKRLVKDLTELLSKGGFHLTKWLSTCNSIMEGIPVEERAKVKNVIDLSGDVNRECLV